MRLVELLSQFRNFGFIGIWEKNSKQHGSLASLSSSQSSGRREPVQRSSPQIGEGSGVLAPNPSFLARRVFFENAFAQQDAFSSREPEVHFARKRFRVKDISRPVSRVL
jgi:hypothetical protein